MLFKYPVCGSDREPNDRPNVSRYKNYIHFYDAIDRESIIILKQLYMEIIQENFQVVHLIINCEGGVSGSIYYWIKSLPIPTITWGEGYICSAATLLFLAGTKRFLAPDTMVLVHSARLLGEHDELKEGNATDLLEHIKMANDIMLRPIYKAECKIPPKNLDVMLMDREAFLDAPTCVKWKIAHDIGMNNLLI
jgi:ATP-dependent Clp protease protease subunit